MDIWNDKERISNVVANVSNLTAAIFGLGIKVNTYTKTKLKNKILEYAIDTSHFNPTRRVGNSIWRNEIRLRSAVSNAKCVADVIRNMGMALAAENYRSAYRNINRFKIDISHFDPQAARVEKRKLTVSKRPIEELLVEHSTYSRRDLKKRLVEDGILNYVCEKCVNEGIWLNEPLTLQLEHKNGASNDNRKENLCFLCPNCHSQTKTFAGRNSKKHVTNNAEIV